MNKVHELPKELVSLHSDGETPPERWLIGAEHELLAVDASGRAPSFEGDQGIEKVLHGIRAEVDGLNPIEEKGRTIALKGRGGSVTLEPGGQVELSGAAHADVHGLAAETFCYQTALEVVAQHHWNTVHAIRRLCKPLAHVETLAVDFEDGGDDNEDDDEDEYDNDGDVGPIPFAGYEIDSDDHFVPIAETIWSWSD